MEVGVVIARQNSFFVPVEGINMGRGAYTAVIQQ